MMGKLVSKLFLGACFVVAHIILLILSIPAQIIENNK